MNQLKRSLSKLLSFALAFLMLFEASGNAFAYMVEDARTASESEDKITLTDSDGNVTEPDESWETTFPYGAFAFEKSGLAVKEGESGVIKVYRLGGTAGRATAYIKYQPSLTKDENGEAIYDFAISAGDVVVSVEEPQPAAKYQPVGKEPDPQETDAAVTAEEGEDGWTLSVDVENAESYAWQVSESGGVWNDLDGADTAVLPADAEALGESYDYRCVYTVDGVRYCTDSLRGTEYVRAAAEELEPMPEDIDLAAEPVYTPLELTAEGEDPYSAWLFELVFADGEWVKELHIDALSDELAEAAEAATFTIVGCDGGAVLDASSTLLLRIEDTNDPEPSTLGFTAELVEADKAEGFATVMIRRVGGKSRPVTVKYATADDTAVAGTDYAYAEGTLLFYGGIDELPVRVELIDDGEVSEDPVRFYIELSELQGDDGCALELSRAAVDLTNSGTGEEENNATRLYDPDAVDLSGSVGESATAASSADSGETVVSGEAQEIEAYEPVYSELRFEDPDSMTTQVYAGNVATILFKNPASSAWTSTVDLASNRGWWSNVGGSLLSAGQQTGKLGSGGKYTLPSGIALTSRSGASASVTGWTNEAVGAGQDGAYVGQMFSQFQASVRADTAHDTAHLTGFHYDYSYTKPNLQIFQSGYLLKTPQDSKRFGSGPLDKNWHIRSSDDWSNYYNPFTSNHTGSFSLSASNVNVKIEMYYASYGDHETDTLNDDTMLAVNSLVLTRRTFTDSAFQVEITTPNDENTAPNGGAVLSDYTNFVPSVEVTNGGVQGSNTLYVGSTVRITAGTTPAGYYLSDVIVYQSTDGGASWTVFDKFVKKDASSNGKAAKDIKLVGGSSSLTADDLTAQYKFRVVYARTSTVEIDLSPSLPRDSSGAVITGTDAINAILNGYGGNFGTASDHGFIKNADPTITYGYSTFSTEDWSTTLSEKTLAKSELSTSGTDGTVLSFSDVNVQWVNFGLSNKDLLLVNGRAYPGDATIYLRESDLSGKMTVYYYHENYQNSLNAMKTSISWIGVYWDANGNGRIDGYFNDAGNFVLEENGDEFYGYIDAGEYNETMFAPKKNASGVYCQYFLKVCYTMIPRCLSVPEDADAETDRAQVMPAFITALNADSPAYSKSTVEQRQYRYLISGLTRYVENGDYDYSADNHPMYLAEAAKKSTVDIPLGGDTHPAEIQNPGEGQKSYYTWTPEFEGALLYEYAAPTPITIENSVAGVTEVTDGYKFENGELSYETGALDKMNAYLGSFTGSTTFALVTQEQNRTVGEGETATKINTTTDTILDKVNPGAYGDYYVKPDSVTLGGVSTTPDASYLKEVNNPKDDGAASNINMDDSGSEMGEFNVDLGIDLGGTEISLTDAVTIILDGNQVGFAIGVPLGEVDKDEGKTGFGDANKESWTQFKDFFDSSNFGGDDDYRKASDSYKSAKSGGYKPDKSDFRSKSMGAEFSMSIAFMFEYNPLDNGFYFEGMTISCSAEFSIRVQGRLTVCPIVYFYMEFTAGIEATTGLGVIREAVEEGDDSKPLNAKGSDQEDKRVKLTYIQSPGAGNAIITAEAYGELGLSERSDYRKVEGLAEDAGAYYWNAKRFASYEAAKENFLDSRDYLLTRAQYDQLSADEQAEYKDGAYYYKKDSTLQDAQTAFHDLTTYEFETPWKAFNICFSGKLSVEVYTKNSEGTWVPAAEDSGFITGFLTSDGQDDTQVVLKKQDDMKLGEPVKVVLRAMNYDDAVYGEQTTISYIARIENIRNEVYWKGIEITPSLGLEVGAGIGMELLKLELYAKVGLEATFLLGVYNENYDPDVEGSNKYKPASVESFEFAIGLGVRVVLLVFTFELDVATYVVEYDGGKWETGWHFLNDWVGQASEPGYLGVTITPPSRSSAQKLYTPEDNAEAEMSTQAINPTDTTVPFQLSGQNSTGVNAFALGTGLLSGTDYKLVRAGGRSFIVYTLSRDSGADEDLPMLVMSEVAYDAGTKTYGLVNPADSASEVHYIVLDADDTGDLDFDVWTEENGTKSTVHAAWVSYATPATVETEPKKPMVDAYEGMTADNFDKIAAPTEPTVDAYPDMTADNYNTIDAPTKPDEVTEPVESDYYTADGDPISEDEFTAITDEAEKPLYAKTADGYQKYTLGKNFTSYADAKAAYDEAKAAYDKAAADKANYDKASESYTKWKEYYTKLESYTKWKTYYTSLSSYNAWTQERLAKAAKNTVVKTASWSFTTTTQTQSVNVQDSKTNESSTETEEKTVYTNDPAFSTPEIRVAKDETNPTHLFAPTVIGSDALFYASVAKTDEGDKEYDLYKQYLDDTNAGSNYRDFLLQTKKSTLDVYGVLSALNVTFQTDDGTWVTSTHELSGKYTVGNIEVKQLGDGDYYVVYTVSADAYEKNSDGEYTDRYTEERLCINRVTVDRKAGTADWSGNYVLRVIRSYDKDTAKDGRYNTSGQRTEAFESPYFSNLSFLNGKIDKEKLTGTGESFTTFSNDTAHDFLLFEMNGTTYVILDDDLKTITEKGTGTIYPFFTGAAVQSKDKDGNPTTVQQVSGKLEVSIGADESGNLYAVYTSAVSGTTNNAIYLASYDPKIGAWSDGVILAMNGMSVYEQSSKNGWSEDLTQAAYWGISGQNGGILNSESAKGLFGESGADIYNTLAGLGTTLGNGKSVTLSGLQTSFGADKEDLLILTRGVTTPLQALATTSTNSAGKTETKWNVTPTYTDGRMDTTSGIYAIRYGHSEKALGEGSISFVQANFSAGSTLQIEASAVNIGDTAFYYDDAKGENALTVTLKAGEQVLLTSQLKENIKPGQTVAISGTAAALEKDLENGTKFTLTVSEKDGTSKDITLFTVSLKPDLGVEQLTLTNPTVSDDGSSTRYEFSFIAANRGSANAEGVFAQISYADADGAYHALDLTASDLKIDPEKSLSAFQTQAASSASELQLGILNLYNAEDGDADIAKGNGRLVHGTLSVPAAAYASGEAKALELRVELFSKGDQANVTTLVTQSVHDEYYTANNAATVLVGAKTQFTAASRIVIPLGTTTLIPLSAVSSRGTKPSITVEETHDANDADGQNIGILNFKQSRASGGTVSGVISITPSSLGTGIINVYDTATNSLVAIAFEVTNSDDGIDIYNDNQSFEFYDKGATEPIDPSSVPANSDWSFTSADKWGVKDENEEAPLRNNLSYGKPGAFFRFSTVAESIDLYFRGTITVSSTDPNVPDATYTNVGGSTPVKNIKIAEIKDGKLDARTITVTVSGAETASFDRLVEHYPGNVVPLPSFDREAPNLYWSRSFPDTGSIKTGEPGIPLKLYALDDGGVSYIEVNGTRYTANDIASVAQLDPDGRLLCYDFGTINANGTYTVAVADTSGNITRETLVVDWFNDIAHDNNGTVNVPVYDVGFYVGNTPVTGLVRASDLTSLNLKAALGEGQTAAEKLELRYFGTELTDLKPETDGSYKIADNGIYWFRALNSSNGTYYSVFLCMDKIDKEIPTVDLTYDAASGKLSWSAAKAGLSAAVIETVTINDEKVNTTTGLKLSGTKATAYNGDYVIAAVDAVGNRVEKTLTVVNAPISIAGSTVTVYGAWNADKNNGKVDLDLTGVIGGTWDSTLSETAKGDYKAKYEVALVPAGTEISTISDWVKLDEKDNMTHVFENLELGSYLLVVRDEAEPGRYTTQDIEITWEAIEADVSAALASYATAEDGVVGVTRTNGRADYYEFAILPAPASWDGKDLSLDTFLASATAEAPLTWLPADNISVSAFVRTFDGLAAGNYLVAVRGLYGATDAEITELKRLGRDLTDAQNALKLATAPDAEQREKLEKAVEDAQKAYSDAAAALTAKNDTIYGETYGNEYWQRTRILPITVGFYSESSVKTAGTNENGSTIIELKPGKKLTSTDSSKIYKENRENSVLLRRGSENVYLPAGTLTPGFDVNRILIDSAAAADGMVVEYTDLDGTKTIVPWCLVSADRVSYFVLGPGDYELVPASCEFTDIAGLWGEDAIRFAAHRGLLSGVGNDLFAPQGTMTRAMFVTVLWRIAGCPAAEAESEFTDLSADWYRASVAWGAETGVVKGLSDTEFGPNYPVTREQMCVLLCRFAEQLGLNIGSAGSVAFSDAGDISVWAMDAIGVCAGNGLILGVGDNRFAPKDTAKRMEVSALFTRFITQMVEKYAPAAE